MIEHPSGIGASSPATTLDTTHHQLTTESQPENTSLEEPFNSQREEGGPDEQQEEEQGKTHTHTTTVKRKGDGRTGTIDTNNNPSSIGGSPVAAPTVDREEEEQKQEEKGGGQEKTHPQTTTQTGDDGRTDPSSIGTSSTHSMEAESSVESNSSDSSSRKSKRKGADGNGDEPNAVSSSSESSGHSMDVVSTQNELSPFLTSDADFDSMCWLLHHDDNNEHDPPKQLLAIRDSQLNLFVFRVHKHFLLTQHEQRIKYTTLSHILPSLVEGEIRHTYSIVPGPHWAFSVLAEGGGHRIKPDAKVRWPCPNALLDHFAQHADRLLNQKPTSWQWSFLYNPQVGRLLVRLVIVLLAMVTAAVAIYDIVAVPSNPCKIDKRCKTYSVSQGLPELFAVMVSSALVPLDGTTNLNFLAFARFVLTGSAAVCVFAKLTTTTVENTSVVYDWRGLDVASQHYLSLNPSFWVFRCCPLTVWKSPPPSYVADMISSTVSAVVVTRLTFTDDDPTPIVLWMFMGAMLCGGSRVPFKVPALQGKPMVPHWILSLGVATGFTVASLRHKKTNNKEISALIQVVSALSTGVLPHVEPWLSNRYWLLQSIPNTLGLHEVFACYNQKLRDVLAVVRGVAAVDETPFPPRTGAATVHGAANDQQRTDDDDDGTPSVQSSSSNHSSVSSLSPLLNNKQYCFQKDTQRLNQDLRKVHKDLKTVALLTPWVGKAQKEEVVLDPWGTFHSQLPPCCYIEFPAWNVTLQFLPLPWCQTKQSKTVPLRAQQQYRLPVLVIGYDIFSLLPKELWCWPQGPCVTPSSSPTKIHWLIGPSEKLKQEWEERSAAESFTIGVPDPRQWRKFSQPPGQMHDVLETLQWIPISVRRDTGADFLYLSAAYWYFNDLETMRDKGTHVVYNGISTSFLPVQALIEVDGKRVEVSARLLDWLPCAACIPWNQGISRYYIGSEMQPSPLRQRKPFRPARPLP
eukprot:TRINITY_DN67088_c5_g2_i3.p1 TRINITY_DN67088_c5_g2~~TRINITY_DN67088_c5_g2_i3.p1  ORF type:complete len:1077 (+),score=76.35 TRINITY_DN67088_c5_g2_i3:333-3233(+)